MSSVIKALNAAYDRIETRPVWKVRLTAVLLVLASGFALAGLFLLVVFGGPIGEAIADQAGLGSAFELIWALLRWPIAFAGLLLFLRARLLRVAISRSWASAEAGQARAASATVAKSVALLRRVMPLVFRRRQIYTTSGRFLTAS